MKKGIWALITLAMLAGCGTTTATESNTGSPSESNSESMEETTTSDSESESLPSSSESSESNSSSASESTSVEVDSEEALKMLKSSPYTSDVTVNEDIGLNSVREVGIYNNDFENEYKYEVPSDATVYKASEIGLSATNENNAGTLSLFIKTLANVPGNKVILFDGITYPFGATVDAVGIQDLYLVGQEGTVWLNTGWGTYFEALACKNVHIMDIVFDMKYSPTVGGEIVNVVENKDTTDVTLQLSDEYDLSAQIYQNYQLVSCSYMEMYYDEQTQGYVPDPNKNLVYNSPTSASQKGVTNLVVNSQKKQLVITISKKFFASSYKKPNMGDKVSFAFTMYENEGFHFNDCENSYFEHVTMHVSGGMGFKIIKGKNVYFNHVQVRLDENSTRLMTCTADIIHGGGVEGDFKIQNCWLESSHDDAINVKTFYTKVDSVNAAAREITVSQTQNEFVVEYEKGDVVEFFDPATMGRVATYTLSDVKKSGTKFILKVDERPRDIVPGQSCGNVTKASHITLENSLIRNKRNRGILLQGRDSVIENCTFQNVVMGAVQVLSVNDQFREAIVPANIVMKDNKFLSNRSGDISVFAYGSSGAVPGTIFNVDIENNYFYNGKGLPVNIRACKDVDIQNNLFEYDYNNNSAIVTIDQTDSINVLNNMLVCKPNYVGDFVKQKSGVTNLQSEGNKRKE